MLNSIDIFDPILTPAMRDHPAWVSWCKLVEVWSVVVQHKLNTSDVKRIDDLCLKVCVQCQNLTRPPYMSTLAVSLTAHTRVCQFGV